MKVFGFKENPNNKNEIWFDTPDAKLVQAWDKLKDFFAI
jgi:hypothetical protein